MLGLLRRVLHQVLWSEALPFLLFFHRPHRHRISKEEARSEAEPEGRPASALSTEPLPWDSDQRTTGPRARHWRKQSSGRPPASPPVLPFKALHADPRQLKASGGLSPEKEFSLFAPRSGFKTNVEDGQSRAGRRLNTCAKKGKGGQRPRPGHRRHLPDLSLPLKVN
ncbi:hypothetical protein AFAEFNGA_00636 [Mycoplasmopsis arginini]|nr:hypothetical protein [Mycoplasmopsis arginini]